MGSCDFKQELKAGRRGFVTSPYISAGHLNPFSKTNDRRYPVWSRASGGRGLTCVGIWTYQPQSSLMEALRASPLAPTVSNKRLLSGVCLVKSRCLILTPPTEAEDQLSIPMMPMPIQLPTTLGVEPDMLTIELARPLCAALGCWYSPAGATMFLGII